MPTLPDSSYAERQPMSAPNVILDENGEGYLLSAPEYRVGGLTVLSDDRPYDVDTGEALAAVEQAESETEAEPEPIDLDGAIDEAYVGLPGYNRNSGGIDLRVLLKELGVDRATLLAAVHNATYYYLRTAEPLMTKDMQEMSVDTARQLINDPRLKTPGEHISLSDTGNISAAWLPLGKRYKIDTRSAVFPDRATGVPGLFGDAIALIRAEQQATTEQAVVIAEATTEAEEYHAAPPSDELERQYNIASSSFEAELKKIFGDQLPDDASRRIIFAAVFYYDQDTQWSGVLGLLPDLASVSKPGSINQRGWVNDLRKRRGEFVGTGSASAPKLGNAAVQAALESWAADNPAPDSPSAQLSQAEKEAQELSLMPSDTDAALEAVIVASKPTFTRAILEADEHIAALFVAYNRAYTTKDVELNTWWLIHVPDATDLTPRQFIDVWGDLFALEGMRRGKLAKAYRLIYSDIRTRDGYERFLRADIKKKIVDSGYLSGYEDYIRRRISARRSMDQAALVRDMLRQREREQLRAAREAEELAAQQAAKEHPVQDAEQSAPEMPVAASDQAASVSEPQAAVREEAAESPSTSSPRKPVNSLWLLEGTEEPVNTKEGWLL